METQYKYRFTQDMKDRWLAALRSGKYKQGTQALRCVNHGQPEYCCLGVLQEIEGIECDNRSLLSHTNPALEDRSVVEGLSCGGYANGPLSTQHELAFRNDGTEGHCKHDFQQIADYIEKNIPALPEKSHG